MRQRETGASRPRAGPPLYAAFSAATMAAAALTLLVLVPAARRLDIGSPDFPSGALAAGASVAAVLAARCSSATYRTAWLAIAAGLAVRAAGWLSVALLDTPPAEWWNPAVAAASNAVLSAGLVLATPLNDGERWWRGITGAVVTMLGVSAVAWVAFSLPAGDVEAGSAGGGLRSAALPASGWLLFTMALFVVQGTDLLPRAGPGMVTGLGSVLLAAGTLAQSYAGDDPGGTGWRADAMLGAPGVVLVGAGAVAGFVAGRRPAPALRRLVGVAQQGIPVCLATALTGLALLRPEAWSSDGFRWLAGSAIAGTLIRQAAILAVDGDVPAVRRAVDALRRRHATIINSSPDLLAVIRPDGTYELANPAFERWLGWEPGSLLGTSVEATIEDADRAMFRLEILAVGHGLRDQGFAPAVRFRTADGEVRTFEVSASRLRGTSADGPSLVMAARDVTERVEALQRLRTSEARTRAILASAPDAILTVAADGQIVAGNAAAETMFGQGPGRRLTDRPIDLLLRPGVHGGPNDGAASLREIATPALRPILCAGTRMDGTTFEAEASLVRLADGDSSSSVIFVRDISQRIRAHTRSLESQKLEAIGQLAGGVAHDFNNLLTVIKGYTDSILSTLPDASEVREDMEEVSRAADRAADLTRQLLAFARRQYGEPGIIEPNTLIRGMGRMLGRMVREDVEIEVLLAEDLSPVLMDPGQFEQVIMNLVVNARDAMPRGGQVMIETRKVMLTQRSGQAAGLMPGSYIEVSVTDTGTGMPPEVMAHIFEPFFTTKPPGEGTGLGLATCYGIVRQAGGAITVDSHPGRGTRFRILLPATAGERAAPDAAPAAVPSPGHETVVLVEDEPSVRAYGRRVLADLGYHVVAAADGIDALAQLEAMDWRVDLVVSDIVMPRMSGRQLAERIRLRAPGMRILFLSGYSAEVLQSRGSLPVDVPLVPKPFTADDLGHAIRRVLDQSREQDRALAG